MIAISSNINIEEQLDDILSVLHNSLHTSERYMHLQQIISSMIIINEELIDREIHLDQCIILLERDGYVFHIMGDPPIRMRYMLKTQIKYYTLTASGIKFIQDGGYANKRRKEITLTNLQSAQTWAIAVGTVLAAIGSIGILIASANLCYLYAMTAILLVLSGIIATLITFLIISEITKMRRQK